VVIEDSPQRLIKYSVEPLGIVLMFPYYADPIMDSVLKLIPSLVAGNAVLIKSPPNFPFVGEYLSAKLLEVCPIPELISDLYQQWTHHQ
jgi:acyl-CoA reductase-like NAD-dependent aldehyde dehydrogenase